MTTKINWLVSHTSPGALILQQWLSKNGIGYSLTQKYVENGWLKRLYSGVYYREDSEHGTKPSSFEAIQALQKQQNFPIHLAGLSSLSYQGLSHYLQLGKELTWIGVENKHALPKWFQDFNLEQSIYINNSKLEVLPEKDLKLLTVKNKELIASSAELAAYEIIDAIGKFISFEHTAELFQGLVNLSPRKVQSLLERSNAIQTNRVFLFLSHYHAHQWVKHLDEKKINLGSGKRQVVKNGKYDERYQITVPENFIKG